MDKWQDHISTEDEQYPGIPVIKGTRIKVGSLLKKLASGWTEKKLLKKYPELNADDIKAVYAYAYDTIKKDLLRIENRPR